MKENVSGKKTGIYIIIFVILVALTFWAVLKNQDPLKVWAVVNSSKPLFLCVAGVLAVSFVLFEAINLKKILCVLGYRISMGKGLKYACTGYFFSAITPSASGGQPMQLYAMNKDGIKLGHGSLTLLIELLCFQGAACLYGLIAVIMAVAGAFSINRYVLIVAIFGWALGMGLLGFLAVAIFSKRFSGGLKKLVIRIIGALPVMKENTKNRCIVTTGEQFQEYAKCSTVVGSNLHLLPKVFGLQLMQFACQFSIAYVVYLAMDQSGASPVTLFFMQALVFIATSFVPLPGAVGAVEGVFLVVFGSVYMSGMVGAAMILGRGIAFYIPVAVCGTAILIIMGKSIFVGAEKKEVENS